MRLVFSFYRTYALALMAEFFQFETDFIQSLRCIPMQVRCNLDTCGVKLKLEHWNHFDARQKESLVNMPCDNTAEAALYRDKLQNWVTQRTGVPAKTLPIDPAPAWHNTGEIPVEVLDKAKECQLSLTLDQWAALSPLQRFALIKLSRPSHENRNFVPAMEEFGLGTTAHL